jgi:large subunit ribosomal protein L22
MKGVQADAYAILRYARCSPKKTWFVASSLQGKKALEALELLKFIRKKPARYIEKALRSAIANAEHNHNIPANQLYIKSIVIGKGPYMRRWKPSAYGRALPRWRKTTHIFVYLERKLED